MKLIFKVSLIVVIIYALMNYLSDPPYIEKSLTFSKQSEEKVGVSDLSQDGKFTLITNNTSVCLWNNETQKLHLSCLLGVGKDYVEIVKIAKNNQYFVISNRVSVKVFSLVTGKLIGEWSLKDHIINDIALSKDAKVILLGFRSGKVSIINPFTKVMATYQKHKLDINSVSLSDNGMHAFTGASDKTAIHWNTQTGKNIREFTHTSRVNYVKISGDNTLGFSVDAIKQRIIWDLSTGEKISELDSNLRFLVFNDAQFSSDNSLLLSGSPKNTLQLWRVSDGGLVAQWETKHENARSSVLSVAFKDDQVLSSTSEGILESWQMPLKEAVTTE